MKENGIIVVLVGLIVVAFSCFYFAYMITLEKQKTIQKAIECGYQPLCIGGDYWNKGD